MLGDDPLHWIVVTCNGGYIEVGTYNDFMVKPFQEALSAYLASMGIKFMGGSNDDNH